MTLALPNLKSAINDAKWRVRLEALNAVVDISLHFSNYEIFVQ